MPERGCCAIASASGVAWDEGIIAAVSEVGFCPCLGLAVGCEDGGTMANAPGLLWAVGFAVI